MHKFAWERCDLREPPAYLGALKALQVLVLPNLAHHCFFAALTRNCSLAVQTQPARMATELITVPR